MQRPHIRLAISLCLLVIMIATGAIAGSTTDDHPRLSTGNSLVFGGRPGNADKVVVDTLLIMGPWGSGALYNGQFETPGGAPAWNGWTSVDLTQSDVSHWHADTYHAVTGTYSAWCGDAAFASCGANDPDAGGYGNRWDETLEWRTIVTNPALPCTLSINAVISHDSEPGYDYSYLSIVQAGATIDLWTADGAGLAVRVTAQTVYLPTDYEGDGNNEVVVRFRFMSDGGWSDEDCSYQSAGALQVDDVQINLTNGTGYSHDFEDGTLGDFQIVFPLGVGDFAKLWKNPGVLAGFEGGNTSVVTAFVDDGLVVPGTGGTTCITWCYGPGGYIVNNTGGLAGPAKHLHNIIVSPRMTLPQPSYEGNDFSFDVWRDERLAADSPGMFFTWAVRTTADTDSMALNDALWVDRNFVYYGGPDWLRNVNVVGDLTVPDARWAQVQLAVYELGWAWGWSATNGTPAPYFDNVRFTSYPFYGPSLIATVTLLPHDNFPESGVLDPVNLASNNVRFDNGQAPDVWANPPVTTPGDSIAITIQPQRAGATLVGVPRLYWRLKANPLFTAAERTAGLGTEGYVDGWQVMSNGSPLVGKFAFDLPDSGFLFPGDFLYYYFSASDTKGGVAQTATLPADTTGFSNFEDPMAYPPIYKLHALPSLRPSVSQPDSLDQPTILFWDDAGAVGNRDEWYTAFANLGLIAGVDYDIYYTNNPSAPAGHGLGGRAAPAQIAGYNDLLYTSGIQAGNTLTGDPADPNSIGDPSNDVALLTAWFQQGGKDALFTGDDLIGDLTRTTTAGAVFASDWLGVDLAAENVLAEIGLQTSPLITADNGNPVVVSVAGWRGVASSATVSSGYYGGGDLTTGTRRYDGVTVRPGAQRLAQFMDPAGFPGAYTYSAATLNLRTDFNARIISFPYDFQSIWTPQGNNVKTGAPLSTRAQILADILTYFGQSGSGAPSPVLPTADLFAANAYPNPFNPKVTIAYNLPLAGRLTVKVFDVRGRLVQTVAELRREAGAGQVQWDGRTSSGDAAAAGVYFYKVDTGHQEIFGKIALIK